MYASCTAGQFPIRVSNDELTANTVQHKVDKLKQSKKARTIRTIYRVKTIK